MQPIHTSTMDLSDLKSGTPATKEWLNIVCNDIKAATATVDIVSIADLKVDEVNTNAITLVNQSSVPNPAVGSRTIYTDLTGVIHTQTPLGDSIAYINESDPVVSVAPESSGLGNIPVFSSADGKTITDSGANLAKINSGDFAIANTVLGVAPSGNRDSWTNTDSKTNTMSLLGGRLYSSSAAAIGGASNYSDNEGVTWSPVTFFTPPSGDFPTMAYGYDEVGTYVSLSRTIGDPAYLSVDGVAFTPISPPPDASGCVSILWVARLGLFIAGTLGSDNEKFIMTSTDGTSWTLRDTPNFGSIANFVQLFDNGSIIVAVVDSSSSGVMWSTDGITWALGAAGPSKALAYSPQRLEWMAIDPMDDIYTSSDGKSWDLTGPGCGVPGGLFCTWVADYQRYYISQPENPAMKLWTTESPNKPFNGSYLDGAHSDNQGYSQLVYLGADERFVVGSGQNGVVYSAARNGVVKSMADQIVVRGKPVSVGMFSMYTGTMIDNTTTELSVTGGMSIGQKTLYAPTRDGTILRTEIHLKVTSVAGDTVTIRLTDNSGEMIAIPIVVSALSDESPYIIQITSFVRGEQIISYAGVQPSAAVLSDSQAFVPIDHEFDITAQWGLAASTLLVDHVDFRVDFPNGA